MDFIYSEDFRIPQRLGRATVTRAISNNLGDTPASDHRPAILSARQPLARQAPCLSIVLVRPNEVSESLPAAINVF